MQLPQDEEGDEKVMGVPELFESTVLCAATLLDCKVHHRAEAGPHEPAGDEGPDDEVGGDEEDDALAGGGSAVVGHGKAVKIDNVSEGVDQTTSKDSPGRRLVEGDVLVERNDGAKRGAAHYGHEVAADGQQNENDIDVQDQCRGTSNR